MANCLFCGGEFMGDPETDGFCSPDCRDDWQDDAAAVAEQDHYDPIPETCGVDLPERDDYYDCAEDSHLEAAYEDRYEDPYGGWQDDYCPEFDG